MTQSDCLNQFRKDYPMVTMGDLHSFTLGMQSRESIILELKNLIEEIKTTLLLNDLDSFNDWIEEQLGLIE